MEVQRLIDPTPESPADTSYQDLPTINPSESCCAEIRMQLGGTPTVSLEDASESQRAILSMIRHLESHIQQLRHKYNMTSAIHLRLPPEILMEIFAQVQPASRKDIRLMHVCQTWRLLLTRTPEFWACMFSALPLLGLGLNTDDTPPWLSTLLDHSAPCFLPLTIYRLSPSIRGALERHAHHISSLHINLANEYVAPFYTMLGRGFPCLESLRMTHTQSATPISSAMVAAVRAVRYSDAVLPLLRTLRLPPIFLTSGLSLDTLRLVEVEGCDCFGCLRPGDVIRRITSEMISSFLKRCPSLQTLRFVGLRHRSEQVTAAGTPIERIALSNLNTLDITEYDQRGIVEVLDCITLSLRTSVTVDLPYAGAFEPNLHTALRNLPVFSTADLRIVMDLCTATEPFRLECFLPDGSLPLVVSKQRSTIAPHQLSTCVARARDTLAMLLSPTLSITTLEIRNISSQMLGKDPQTALFLQDIFIALPHLAALTLDVASNAVLSSLPPVLRFTAEGGGVICPMLQTLALCWCVPPGHDADVFFANCRRIKVALDARAKRLSAFSFTCTWILRLEGPAKKGKELLFKRLEKVFAATADQVTVEVYRKDIATNE